MSVEIAYDTVLPIPKLFGDMLLREREAEGNRVVAGDMLWRASSLGNCLRRQYIELYLKCKRPRPLSAENLARMEVGDFWEEWFERMFKRLGLIVESQTAYTDEGLNVGAHGDFVITNQERTIRQGVEAKSMQSMYFWHRIRAKAPFIASRAYLIQAGCQWLLAELAGDHIPWTVLSASKDDLTLHMDVVPETFKLIARMRLEALNDAVRLNKPPECECFDPEAGWGGREWKFCDWYAGTDESRTTKKNEWQGDYYKNGKKKYVGIYKPDGECCTIPEATPTEGDPSWL